jgi:hypothetical protein
MIPESSSQNNLSLYKSKTLPYSWSKISVLVNEPLIDATLFFHKSYYWIFYTRKSQNNPQDSELNIMYSKDLNQEFVPHKNNPVKINSSSSRPAGNIFILGNKIYRPAQNCKHTYGGAITINEILDLSQSSFSEKKCFEISPETIEKEGVHTLNFTKNYIVIDAKKIIFSPMKIFVNYSRRLVRIYTKLKSLFWI